MITVNAKQIRWKCRRGMLELDYLLLNFFDRYYETLPANQKTLFSNLLDSSDVVLYQWLINRNAPEHPEFSKLIHQILLVKN